MLRTVFRRAHHDVSKIYRKVTVSCVIYVSAPYCKNIFITRNAACLTFVLFRSSQHMFLLLYIPYLVCPVFLSSNMLTFDMFYPFVLFRSSQHMFLLVYIPDLVCPVFLSSNMLTFDMFYPFVLFRSSQHMFLLLYIPYLVCPVFLSSNMLTFDMFYPFVWFRSSQHMFLLLYIPYLVCPVFLSSNMLTFDMFYPFNINLIVTCQFLSRHFPPTLSFMLQYNLSYLSIEHHVICKSFVCMFFVTYVHTLV